MNSLPRNLIRPAIIGFLLVLPFVILEVINQTTFNMEFPFPLFILMWLLAASSVLIATPLVRSLRTSAGRRASVVSLMPRVVLVILIAWLWVDLVADQMPCFLGRPNCD